MKKLFLEDKEIQTIINALYHQNHGLLSESKPEDSLYNKSSAIKDCVDAALQHNKKIINMLEDIKNGMDEKFKEVKSRL